MKKGVLLLVFWGMLIFNSNAAVAALTGDINNDGKINFVEAIYALQVMAGMNPIVDPLVDNDGDGFSAPADCDDNNKKINPAAAEICGDEIDDNCDSVVACPQSIADEIAAAFGQFVDIVNANGANLASAQLEGLFHQDYLDEGRRRELEMAAIVDEMRGANLPADFFQVLDVVDYNPTSNIATVVIGTPDDRWQSVLKQDVDTGIWQLYGDQQPYDMSVHFGIYRNYGSFGTSVNRAVWVEVWSLDKDLAGVTVSGTTIFPAPQTVQLDSTEQLQLFYTPTASITTTERHYELYSDSFGDFPPVGSEFTLAIDDGSTVEQFTVFSNRTTDEALTGTEFADYSIDSAKGKSVELSFTLPQTFAIASIEWEWRANDAGPWLSVEPVNETTATFQFPTQVDINGSLQNIDRIMAQVRVKGVDGEDTSIYWMFGYNY
jgi:hypothetical protein